MAGQVRCLAAAAGGHGGPEDVEPGVVDGLLQEREGVLGVLFDDGDDDQAG
jgi:hypothetical protein